GRSPRARPSRPRARFRAGRGLGSARSWRRGGAGRERPGSCAGHLSSLSSGMPRSRYTLCPSRAGLLVGCPAREHERPKETSMAYVVTDNCENCLFTDCVAVCPVDCFYADDRMMYIHPDECIDCDACVPACPVQAIFNASDCPDAQTRWIQTAADK